MHRRSRVHQQGDRRGASTFESELEAVTGADGAQVAAVAGVDGGEDGLQVGVVVAEYVADEAVVELPGLAEADVPLVARHPRCGRVAEHVLPADVGADRPASFQVQAGADQDERAAEQEGQALVLGTARVDCGQGGVDLGAQRRQDGGTAVGDRGEEFAGGRRDVGELGLFWTGEPGKAVQATRRSPPGARTARRSPRACRPGRSRRSSGQDGYARASSRPGWCRG